MEFVGLVLALIAVLPIAAYFVLRMFYSPKIEFRVVGEQLGEPIPVPGTGSRFFAVSTRSNHRVELSEVLVAFEPDEVDLSATLGAEIRSTLDTTFPLALFFGAKRIVAKRLLQAIFFDHKAKTNEFRLRFTALANVDGSELPFLLDMFPTKTSRAERVVRFKVTEDAPHDPMNTGLMLRPHESMSVEGAQAQAAFWGTTDTPGTTMRVIETIERAQGPR